jgi:hypothetical protein
MYLSGKITADVFCNEFYYSYDLEIDCDVLTGIEKIAFAGLSPIVARFSEFEEDHIKYPKAYFTEQELKQKILETKEYLQKQWPL